MSFYVAVARTSLVLVVAQAPRVHARIILGDGAVAALSVCFCSVRTVVSGSTLAATNAIPFFTASTVAIRLAPLVWNDLVAGGADAPSRRGSAQRDGEP